MIGATRRSICSVWLSKRREAARMAWLQGLLVPLANDRGILTTSWRANEKRATASAETKLPIAPLSTRILTGAWLSVPCCTRGLRLSSVVSLTLLMSRGSCTGAAEAVFEAGVSLGNRRGVRGGVWVFFGGS